MSISIRELVLLSAYVDALQSKLLSPSEIERKLDFIHSTLCTIRDSLKQSCQNILLSTMYASSAENSKPICQDMIQLYYRANHLNSQVTEFCNQPLFKKEDIELAKNGLIYYQKANTEFSNVKRIIKILFERLCTFILYPSIIDNAKNGSNGKETTLKIRHNVIQQRIIQLCVLIAKEDFQSWHSVDEPLWVIQWETIIEAIILNVDDQHNDMHLITVLQQITKSVEPEKKNDFQTCLQEVGIIDTMKELLGRYQQEDVLFSRLTSLLHSLQ